MNTKIIFLNIAPEDFVLASRAARYQLDRPDGGNSTILAYGEGADQKHFFVKRNKASITVRPC